MVGSGARARVSELAVIQVGVSFLRGEGQGSELRLKKLIVFGASIWIVGCIATVNQSFLRTSFKGVKGM